MDPYLEQRLRDEVIYLHSLWHQGPPNRRNPTPRPAPPRRNPPLPLPDRRPQTSTTQFEIPTPNKKPFQPDPRWESPGPTRPDDSTWPQSSPQLSLARALEVCGGFFSGSGSGSESEEEEDEDGENEEYKLLLKVFVEESELRKLYEGNWDEGEFYCLVLVVLLPNSLDDDDANQCKDTLDKGISETKEDGEEAVDMQGEPEVNADQLDNVLENNVAAENAAAAESSENEATADHQCNDKEQMISQSSLKDDGTDKSRVNLDKGNVVSINEETLEEAKVQRRNLGRLWLMEHQRHLSCRYVLTQLVTPQQSLVNSKMVISCVMGIYQMIEG